jgi:hypothetical protein
MKVDCLAAGMAAGADSIDDIERAAARRDGEVFAGVRAPSTLGRSCGACRGGTSGSRRSPRRVPGRPGPLGALAAGADVLAFIDIDSTQGRLQPSHRRYPLGRPATALSRQPVPLENSQRVWVALGGHETCPRPVPGGLAWRGMVAAARVACGSVLPGRRPRRGVLTPGCTGRWAGVWSRFTADWRARR